MVNSRNKGSSFERKVAKLLEDFFQVPFNRTPQSGAFATNTKDSRLLGDIYSPELDLPFVIECKSYEDYNLEDLLVTGSKGNIVKWINQLEIEKQNKLGLLIFKRNYGKIFCAVENVKFEPSFIWKNYYIGLLEVALPKIKEYVDEYLNR